MEEELRIFENVALFEQGAVGLKKRPLPTFGATRCRLLAPYELGYLFPLTSRDRPPQPSQTAMTSVIEAQIPEQLLAQANVLIDDGWASNIDEILTEALSRYLDSHSTDLSEAFIREDIEWGLRGTD